MKPMRNILVPVDFSPTSRAALDRAMDLAERFDGNVTLLHVYHFPPYELTDSAVNEITTAADRSLEALASDLKSAGIPINARTARGSLPEAIVDFAKGEGVELIVIGTHGRTGVRHAILGSVAERVVRTAPCPVLTVRA